MLHQPTRPMAGRDPNEAHRVATSLELLFDLTFATCFSLAASQFAHALADGRYASALFGYTFASFAICWAWMNVSWFSSAYDTDDWIVRVVTLVQMFGVLVLATGLSGMFASIELGRRLDNSVMVLGYVIIRVALVSQWLRAARQDPARRRACLTYAIGISIAQIGWVVLIFARFSGLVTIILGSVLALMEFSVPVFAERKDGGTPWHAHHIAERYSLFVLIGLGEGIVGTVAALSAVVAQRGWTLEAGLVGIVGTGLTFGIWWIYFLVPSALLLQEHRDRVFLWAAAQMIVVIAVVATGAGLHVAAYFIEHKAHISLLATVLSVAIPVGVLGILYSGYASRVFVASILLIAAVPAPSVSAQIADLRNLSVFHFDFDNDVFLGKDSPKHEACGLESGMAG
jgi:low temperature requirement protein LtrA